MPMFTVKAGQVEARQVCPELVEDIAQWCKGRQVEEIDAVDPNQRFVGVNVPLPWGEMARASEGDWVIRYENNTFAVIDNLGLLDNYDAVE